MPKKTGAYEWLDRYGVRMHAEGLIDRQLAKAAGCARNTVSFWRKSRGLPPNAPKGSEDWRACIQKWIDAYTGVVRCVRAGMTDKEAALHLGISVENYRGRRIRYGMQPGRYERVQHRESKLKKYEDE